MPTSLMPTNIGPSPRHNNNVGPTALTLVWLTEILERIVAGHTKANEIDTLLPWNWKTQAALQATA